MSASYSARTMIEMSFSSTKSQRIGFISLFVTIQPPPPIWVTFLLFLARRYLDRMSRWLPWTALWDATTIGVSSNIWKKRLRSSMRLRGSSIPTSKNPSKSCLIVVPKSRISKRQSFKRMSR